MEMKLLSGAVLDVRKWKLSDMDTLMKANGRSFLPTLLRVFKACTLSVLDPGIYHEFDWGKVYEGDIYDALWQWRALSVGPLYAFGTTCSNTRCRAKLEFPEYDVTKVTRKPVPPEVLAHLKEGKNRFEVPWSRGSFLFLIPTADEVIAMENSSTSRRASTVRAKGAAEEVVEEQSLVRALRKKILKVTDLEGVTYEGGKLTAWLEDLDLDEAGEIFELTEHMNFGIDTAVEVFCSDCGTTTPMDLPMQKSFFLSTVGRPKACVHPPT